MRRAASRVFWLVPRRVELAVELEVAEVQVLRRLASELMRGAGEVPFGGKVVPGEEPVLGLARLAAMLMALVRPTVLVAEAPMLPPVERN
jgi:hypothetical protein